MASVIRLPDRLPDRLPVAVRMLCVHDNPPELGNGTPRPSRRPGRFVMIAQPPEGVASPAELVMLTGSTRTWRVTREIVVPRDRAEIGAGGAEIMTPAEARRFFRGAAYRYRNLVLGFDLPSAIAALARDWRPIKKGKFAGGWRFLLDEDKGRGEEVENDATGSSGLDPVTAEDGLRPDGSVRILVKPNVTLMDFDHLGRAAPVNGESDYHQGDFGDVRTIAYYLSASRPADLAAAAAALGVELEPLPADPLAAHRQYACNILDVAAVAIRVFEVLPGARTVNRPGYSETRIHSPAGLGRALLALIGIRTPPFISDREMLALSDAAFFGGRIARLFRGIALAAILDYRKQYVTCAALLDIQRFLFAERLHFIEIPVAVAQTIADGADPYDPMQWPEFAILCEVVAAGETLPGKHMHGGAAEGFTLTVAPRWSDDPIALFMPDLVASRIACGRAPKIVRAWRLVPEGRRPASLLVLPSGAVLDPEQRDLFVALAEEGERLRRGQWKGLTRRQIESAYTSWKMLGNGLAMGKLAETNEVRLAPGKREEVERWIGRECGRGLTERPEDPGPLFCPPLAALVTAAGRLLLALAHRAAEDAGCRVLYSDTDNLIVPATPAGGPVKLRTSRYDPREQGVIYPEEPANALSDAGIEAISARLDPLNPFDRTLLPGSPLQIKRRGIEAHLLSSKRYSLWRDGVLVERKETVIGTLAPPWPDADRKTFIDDVWAQVYAHETQRAVPAPTYFNRPATRILVASNPDLWPKLAAVAGRPFGRFLVTQAWRVAPSARGTGEFERCTAVAPYERDSRQWASLPWREFETGNPLDPSWRLDTIRRTVQRFQDRVPSSRLGPDGRPCTHETRGFLAPRPVWDGPLYGIGKEQLALSADPREAFTRRTPELVRAGGGSDGACNRERDSGEAAPEWPVERRTSPLWDAVRGAAGFVGAAALARRLHEPERTVRSWISGEKIPDPGRHREIARAVVACAADLGLIEHGEREREPEQACAALVSRMETAVPQIKAMAAALLLRYGSFRKAESATGIPARCLAAWEGGRMGRLHIPYAIAELGLAARQISQIREKKIQ